jgi:hypothetical protein
VNLPGPPGATVIQHRWRRRRTGRAGRVLLVAGAACVVALATTAIAVRAGLVDLAGPRWVESAIWVGGSPPEPTEVKWSTVDGPAPSRLRVPAIGLDAPLEQLALDPAGVLAAPVDFARPGWYAGGTAPGDPGPAVIAGHVDSKRGPAVFFRLHELKAGDVIEVARGDRWVTFRVASAGWYPKANFPTAEVYGPTPDPQLRLITCGGDFDRSHRSYKENLIVFAVGG